MSFRYHGHTNASSHHREAALGWSDSGAEEIPAIAQRRKSPEQPERNPEAATRSGVYSVHNMSTEHALSLFFIYIIIWDIYRRTAC